MSKARKVLVEKFCEAVFQKISFKMASNKFQSNRFNNLLKLKNTLELNGPY
jgi:hypothetical protein